MRFNRNNLILGVGILLVTCILSWFYYTDRIRLSSLSNRFDLSQSHTSKLLDSDVVVFLWDIPSIHQDWTGLLANPTLENHFKLEQEEEDEEEESRVHEKDSDYMIPTKLSTDESECSVSCYFTHKYEDFQQAHAILFDPVYMYKENWKRIPIKMPEKHPHQKMSLLHYSIDSQYTILSHPKYVERMDYSINYDKKKQNPMVPEITLACSPYSSGSINKAIQLLHKPISQFKKTKGVAFMSSNCLDGYASIRTNTVADLMQQGLPVDSFGKCLFNMKSFKTSAKDKHSNINQRIRYNAEIFKDYKFVIAFENDNSTNYVTEKAYSALYAGAIPIYMGARNIDDWLPTGSFINANNIKSREDLVKLVNRILHDPKEYQKYFEWKERPLESKVLDKLNRCVNSFQSKCNICELYYKQLSANQTSYRKSTKFTIPDESPNLEKELNLYGGYYQSFFLEMTGKGDHIIADESEICPNAFNFTNQMTFMAWIRPQSFGDQRLIDKNPPGVVKGYNFDIQRSSDSKYGYLRLCAAENCFDSTKRLSSDVWHHVTVVLANNNLDIHKNKVTFYIDGEFDFHYDNLDNVTTNTLPLTFGKVSNQEESNSGTYHGYIDNIMIFNISLSHEQVKKFVWNKPFGDEEGLVLYYDFDYNNLKVALDRTLVEDKSICGHHGHLIKGSNNDYSQRILSYGKDITFNKCL